MKLKTYILPIFFIAALALATSCKSTKSVLGTKADLEQKEHNEVMTDALNAELNYKTLSTKGSVEIRKGKSSKKVTTYFKMVKDSMIQASVRPLLGMEAIRVTFTPDSVIVIDRLKKQYVAENLNKAMKSNNVDFNFYNLQALFTNRIFLPGKKEITKKDFKQFSISNTDDVYLARTIDKSKLTYNFAIDATDRVISTLVFNTEKSFTLQWSYEDFVKDGEYFYPKSMLANVDIAKVRLDLAITYSKLDIDGDISIDSSIPNKYEKVDFKEFISSYIK